ncbi:MBL fold metallo-hydrolase [Thalassotalea sp. G2M2-11]|uniref:MBL fold metallo-hydrolase n=1 Tax=Thalassotalea sp. G2M2-11 TaxID=2787627 RepID=UPI0019CF66A0|nr:MBL fold metallo-hydrolase [Thalassotalea sp. G2M2-11]
MKLHKISGYIQTIYLVEYPHGLLLLDGCSRADITTLAHFIIHKLGRSFSDLTTVVVTHMHPDHAGAANQLRKLTQCTVASANVSGQWYSGIDGFLMHLTDMALTQWVAKRKAKPRKNIWYSRKLTADVALNDGDTIPHFPDWQALFTQGHTDRDLSLYHRAENCVYIADLLVKVKGKATFPYPIFYPNRYKASLNRIKHLQVNKILLAHGNDIQLSDEEFEQIIAQSPSIPMTHWRSTKAKLKKVLFGVSRLKS